MSVLVNNELDVKPYEVSCSYLDSINSFWLRRLGIVGEMGKCYAGIECFDGQALEPYEREVIL